MNPFEEITIEVAESNEPANYLSDNVKAILHEINSMQYELVNNNQSGVIDLRGLPLLPGEYAALKHILGEGEVKASLDTMGTSTLIETTLTGVWWVYHNDENNERLAEFIEVTEIPEILKSNKNEIKIAYTVLKEQLQADSQ